MSHCMHCGTPFSPSLPDEQFCCKGCEYVYDLIHDEGLDRFYDLRRDAPLKPARGMPFEPHDFSWLERARVDAEEEVQHDTPVEAVFSLDGISCVGCIWLVEKIYMKHAGAVEASAHPATGRLHLRWLAGQMELVAFADELSSFGYLIGPVGKGTVKTEPFPLGARTGLCGAFALNAMAFTLPGYLGMPADFAFSGVFQLVTFLSATLSMMIGGSYFIHRAWNALRVGSVHIDLPIALGLILAYAGSIAGWAFSIHGLLYFDFVSTFVFLMLGGRYFQLSAVERNKTRLQRQRPVPENLVSPDHPEPVALDEIEPGLRFEIKPGQSVPVAAVLDSASADFSLEWISGEADSQTFHAGRPVPAGAIYLGSETVVLTAGESWKVSLLSRLVANDRPVVKVPGLEKLLTFYLIAVMIIGVGAFAWWYSHDGLSTALQVMISVFVVSCPCALGVALPLADELCRAIMERAGVFIREPLLWSRLRKVRTILFDKTGTLTLERPVLRNPKEIESLEPAARLALARLASGSLHPVSRALLESLGGAGQKLLRSHPGVDVEDIPGTGRAFTDEGLRWTLGKPDVSGPHDAELCVDGKPVACFRFSESLRPDAVASLAALRRRKLRFVILSGDRPEKVAAAADLLGIPREDAKSSLQPGEKEAFVRSIDHHDTLFLGDGANDSLAFNAAWTTGTPVVDRNLLESKADFYFLGKGLGFLPSFLSLAIRRRQVVLRAFSFALIYNITVVAIAVSGHMNPLLAAVLMPLSSLVSLAIVAGGLKDRRVDRNGNPSYGSAEPAGENHHGNGRKALRTSPV